MKLEKHPQNYLLFCCDRDHVEYVKKYFGQSVAFVDFMPHVGIIPDKNAPAIPYKEKKYDILFSGTYYPPESILAKMEELFGKGTSPFYLEKLYGLDFECDSRSVRSLFSPSFLCLQNPIHTLNVHPVIPNPHLL